MIKEKVYFWPAWFLASQPSAEGKKIHPAILKKLSQGQIYLWRALNIYDDFLDGAGEPHRLPLANAYYRRWLEIHYRLNLPADYYCLFNAVISDLDAANREETSASRLKIAGERIFLPTKPPAFRNLTDLSRKSLTLALGPIALLELTGHKAGSREIKAALDFWRTALAAKQLADDARDWLADLKNGALTAVNILILRAAKKRRLILNFNDQTTLNLLFANFAAALSAKQIKALCARARRAGAKINLGARSQLIKEIICPLENAVAETERFRRLLAAPGKKML